MIMLAPIGRPQIRKRVGTPCGEEDCDGLASMTSSLGLLSRLSGGGEKWGGRAQRPQVTPVSLGPPGPGTSVMQVMASDADDPTYGSSARLVYSVLDGEHHFTVDPKTGRGGIRPKGRGAEPGAGSGGGVTRGGAG